MAINIKNERVCTLAREAAAVSGLSQTSAIEAALEKYIEEYVEERGRSEDEIRIKLAQIDAIVEDFQRVRLDDPYSDLPGSNHDWLYDEEGLPR